MGEGATIASWPELLRPDGAAAMLSLSPSAWRAIFPMLAARHGLKIIGLCGPKFSRSNILDVIQRLQDLDLEITIDQAARTARVGTEEFPITTSRTGKSNRGRPRKAPATV